MNRPSDALNPYRNSLRSETCIGEQANHLGIKRLNNNTDINIDQEDPRFSLNLLTEAAEHLAQQGHAEEGGRGKSKK